MTEKKEQVTLEQLKEMAAEWRRCDTDWIESGMADLPMKDRGPLLNRSVNAQLKFGYMALQYVEEQPE